MASRSITRSSLAPARLVSNRAALLAAGILIGLQLVFTYTPPFQTWFGTAGLRGADWGVVVAAGLAVFFLVELEKAIMRHRRPPERSAQSRPAP